MNFSLKVAVCDAVFDDNATQSCIKVPRPSNACPSCNIISVGYCSPGGTNTGPHYFPTQMSAQRKLTQDRFMFFYISIMLLLITRHYVFSPLLPIFPLTILSHGYLKPSYYSHSFSSICSVMPKLSDDWSSKMPILPLTFSASKPCFTRK